MGGRTWSPEEIEYLRGHLDTDGVSAVANALKRSDGAVVNRAQTLGMVIHEFPPGFKKPNYALKKRLYWQRANQGICTRCGKVWAEAGQRMCKACRELSRKWWRDNNMDEYANAKRQKLRAERRESGRCTECGRKLKKDEIGVNTACSVCRAKNREMTNTRRIRDRIHGIPRKG